MESSLLDNIQELESPEKSPSSIHEDIPQAPVKTTYQKSKSKKPKRNKSAFILFSIDMRAKLKTDVQDQINSNEMMVKLAELWKQLPTEEKERYNSEAKSDKMRYLQELDDFSKAHPTETIHNKTKKNHVKKPCSSYAIFLKEMKNVIKDQSPNLKMADVLKIVSEKWKALTEEEKAVYQDRAKKEKELVKAKLDENLQNSLANNPSQDDPGAHKKLKGQAQRPNPAAYDIKSLMTQRTQSMKNEGASQNFSSSRSNFSDLDPSLLSIVRSQSFQLPKRAGNDEDGKSLLGLLDRTLEKSRELIVDLLNFNLPSERLDSLNLFEKSTPPPAPKTETNTGMIHPLLLMSSLFKTQQTTPSLFQALMGNAAPQGLNINRENSAPSNSSSILTPTALRVTK